ncbi:hypothetical protein KAR91_34500 [Candidatus Pacearchaeota archaeon]|nr:hypothetical protein [Candidatus Pacearchaeota archaeon]
MSQETAKRSMMREKFFAIFNDIAESFGGKVELKQDERGSWLDIQIPKECTEACVKEMMRQEKIYVSGVEH